MNMSVKYELLDQHYYIKKKIMIFNRNMFFCFEKHAFQWDHSRASNVCQVFFPFKNK